MKIAICDDEKVYRDEISSAVSHYMFRADAVITSDTYESAEKLLEVNERYDLYLLDYAMPGMNGVALAVKLREKFGDSVSVCFLTTYETAAVEVINRKIQADAFLVKPVPEKDLMKLIGSVYNQSAQNRVVLKKDKSNITVFFW